MNSPAFALPRGPFDDLSLLTRSVRQSWNAGRRPIAAVLATCAVAGCTMAERARAFRPLLEHFGVERPGLPLVAAIVRLPLSLAVSSPDLPAWGAALQVLGAVALGELLFGWRRTVAVGLVAHAVATMSVRVMIAVGSGPLSLPSRYLGVRDTGPSAAVVGILAYVVVRCRARWALAAIVGLMLAELVALPNLAGHEHINAIVAGALIALAEKGVRSRRAGSGARPESADVPVNSGGMRKRTTAEDRRRSFTTARRLALLTAGIGIVTLVSALVPASHGRLRLVLKVLPGALPPGAAAASAAAGVLLLLLARGLAGRKRRAWQGTVVLLAVSAVLHLVKGFDIEEAAGCFVVLGLLTARRDVFKALPDPRSRSLSVVVLAGFLLFDLSVGFALVASEALHRGPAGFRDLVLTVVRGMVGVSGPVALTGQRGDTIADLLVAFSVLTVAVSSWLALRPAREAPTMSADDATRMRALVEREGASDSLAYFALRPDKSVIWSPTGKSAIAYRVVGGVMLASGDPLGDKEAWPGAINAFIERADGHGWIPAALGCGDVAAKAWARAGLAPFELGDEAIVDVESFHLEGRPMRNVRQTVTRVQRLGYTASVVRTGDLTQTRREDLGRQAAAWRGEVTERGFSMALGRIAGTSDPDAVLVVAHDAHGSIRGLLQFVPWGKTGWSLDVMRRDPAAANGVNELMITTALHHAAGLGVRNISLNFAVFRSTLERGERLGAGFFSVWLLRLLMAASRWWQIESLYRFNAKFQPSWNTRYLCYPTLADLPRVVAATLLAEAFVRPPRRLAGAMRQGSLTPTMH